MTFGVILVGIPLVRVAALSESIAIIGLVVALLVLIIMALILVSNTLSGIYVAAVYRYATTGEAGSYFDSSMVEGAFRPKD